MPSYLPADPQGAFGERTERVVSREGITILGRHPTVEHLLDRPEPAGTLSGSGSALEHLTRPADQHGAFAEHVTRVSAAIDAAAAIAGTHPTEERLVQRPQHADQVRATLSERRHLWRRDG